jgi:hypothetical protein
MESKTTWRVGKTGAAEDFFAFGEDFGDLGEFGDFLEGE